MRLVLPSSSVFASPYRRWTFAFGFLPRPGYTSRKRCLAGSSTDLDGRTALVMTAPRPISAFFSDHLER